ncbi:MAG: SpoIID/LytB domain-containing protein [Bacteroidia bacterium]
MKKRIILLLIIFCTNAHSQEIIRVGLFKASKIKAIEVFPEGCSSTIEIGEAIKFSGNSGNSPFYLSGDGNQITVFFNDIKIGSAKEIVINNNSNDFFFFKPAIPDLKGNSYKGKVIFRSSNGVISSVNELPVNDYLNGVIRGEIGFDKDPVVYEVHAIISRTYVYRFFNKHESEGFNVCDQTHCQVYKGFFDYEQFINSIEISDGIVLRDPIDFSFAEGLFHANCGGRTNASEDVWSAKLSYCRPVIDSFCLTGKHANWEKQYSIKDLEKKLGIESSQLLCEDYCFFSNDRVKKIRLGYHDYETISLRNILKLKSSYFNWECDSDSVIISGKGFGHGVGLCQEGAIKMAEMCFSAEDILQFYYSGILIDQSEFRKKNKLLSDRLSE